ncbi:MAG: MFS transporter, partial [Candidatus Omnitrophica bacterium]|nr:MFS transporter [Candidatus Omnitrophota bacterium]
SSFLYHSLQQRLGVYFSQIFSLKQLIISSIFTVSTFSSIAFEFLGGIFSSRFGFVKITRIGFFLMSIFSFSLVFVNDYKLLYALIALWGIGWALSHVGLSSRLTHFEDSIMRDASSLNSSLRFAFGGLGALAGGIFAYDLGSYKLLFFIVTLFIFMLGVFLNRIINEGEESYG